MSASIVAVIDGFAHEATLFAAIGFLIGGIDDLAVDLLYLLRRLGSWPRLRPNASPILAGDSAHMPGRMAVFIGAWDESAVIGRMLGAALARFDHPDYRLYVGTYPNDPATIRAVAAIADPRVRLVVGSRPGPTTKADCLNGLWRALLRDEIADGVVAKGVVLHDAEDIVHPDELRVLDHCLDHHAAAQVPVLPLVHPRSRLVSGHYCDEFAEAHAKQLVVREAVGAAMPFAGVGCAIGRAMLARIAEARGGDPFDASSLTEDYELGLTVAAMGGRAVLARVVGSSGLSPVAVRAYFPGTFQAAVRQKARWMTGIAFAGWDRVGWSAAGDWAEHWMRMRDRRAILAIPVLAAAYAALLAWGALAVLRAFATMPAHPLAEPLGTLLAVNAALLGWRVAMRGLFVGRAYGWREALWSFPRLFVANFVALFAARRALGLYLGMLRGGAPRWEKTAHEFPEDVERAAA